MVELGEHAETHVLPRLNKVVDGQESGGVTEATDWQGGGGFRYYTLAPSLLEKDKYDNWVISKKYDANMLAAAVCKLMGFTYEPSRDEREYWRHGHSTETDFIYVTTQSLTYDALKRLSEDVGRKRTLLVCCKAYNAKDDAFDNITLRKIPQVVLKKCEWGRDDYSLKIAKVAPPEEPVVAAPPEAEAEATPATTPKKRTRKPRKKPDADATPDMFAKRVGAWAMSADRIRANIKARLSLRDPQADSLDILADVLERISFDREPDLDKVLAAIQAQYPDVTDFERDFPSLCFAIATGVGKTRLMGAFITYLYLTGRSRNAFVLAPNTTIYEKLRRDFDPKHSKYVFKGIAELAQNLPVIVTGDDWDKSGLLLEGAERNGGLVVNIFNVDKINKDKGRVKRLHEYLGQAYFDYLADLPDLVLIMDEAHRYRASSGAAMKAIADLDPVIGLELTATPMSTGSKSKRFKNVIYDYSLGQAMADGYVKEPAVATRSDFDPKKVTPEQLQRIKLEDGIHCHENVKAELDIYHRQTGKPKVHPFTLVVATDTDHARDLQAIIEADDFFGGHYKGRVIQVHSGLTGVETEEATQKLLAVETDGKTDVVIHVNKLKEGWDVTNLYTIVPLRASASEILTEQTLGRGLRLPYGTRTGVEAIDTLTVIAHDRFKEVVDAARDPNSIVAIKKTIIIGGNGDVSDAGAESLVVPSAAEAASCGSMAGFGDGMQAPYIIESPEEREAAQVAIQVIQSDYERALKRGFGQLAEAATQSELTRKVSAILDRPQGQLDGIVPKVDVGSVVAKVVANVTALTIEIPRIVVLPKGDVNFHYADFDLNGLDGVAKQPISDKIMIQRLRDEARTFLARPLEMEREEHPENYLVRHLLGFPQIDYDEHADLLMKLCGQMLRHLRSYLPDERAVENVLLVHGEDLARFIFAQMERHYRETPVEYEAEVTAGFTMLKPQAFKVTSADAVRNYRVPVVPAGDTKRHVFGGFRRCCYPYQKFHSNEERAFAVIIDSPNEPSILKWMKPGAQQFRIEYASGQDYEPDFVVETDAEKIIAEIKRRDEIHDDTVQAKARAASKWVGYANAHARQCNGKPWTYALIPHDAVNAAATLRGLVASHARQVII